MPVLALCFEILRPPEKAIFTARLYFIGRMQLPGVTNKPGLVQVFKAHYSVGTQALDVMPQGATTAYAAPEVLYSLQLQFDPHVRHDQVQEYLWINGASADWWSLGAVLFELLTEELPFKAAEGSRADTCMSVSSHYRHPWEDYRFFAAQQTCVRAISTLCDIADFVDEIYAAVNDCTLVTSTLFCIWSVMLHCSGLLNGCTCFAFVLCKPFVLRHDVPYQLCCWINFQRDIYL